VYKGGILWCQVRRGLEGKGKGEERVDEKWQKE
jgi:hypothetical protein